MLRFTVSEYIRNMWFNICMILIMIFMLLIAIMFVSNIDSETGLYRLTSKYLEKDSIFIDFADNTLMNELNQNEGILIAKTLSGYMDKRQDLIRMTVYSEELMRYLKPVLDDGTYPKDLGGNTISVLISNNSFGIDTGDRFTYHIIEQNGEYIDVDIYVAGIISEGQKVYNGDVEVSNRMTYEDFFTTYSYEQSGEVIMIVMENELMKAGDFSNFYYYKKGIMNLNDDISQEDRMEIMEKIRNYELRMFGSATVDAYPDAEDMIKRGEKIYINVLSKYVPLLFITVVLFIISIIGIVTIKVVKSTRYFGIMYVCGMDYKKAVLITGIEMLVNSIVAVIFSIILIKIQNIMKIVGDINCRCELPEIAVACMICISVIYCSVHMTIDIIKDNSISKILKEF